MAASSSDWPVHQLWPPSGGKQSTELDVVLFHGLQLTANDTSDAWSSTWTQRGHDDVCWAQEWLPFDLGEAIRIFSVSYNAHVVTSPHGHVSEIADNLFQNLMDRRYDWHQPIVLIGHSFGGLVLKSLVVKLNRVSTIRNPTNFLSKAMVQRAKVFLRNLRGVAFYAVPHAGSSNIAIYLNKLLRCDNRHHRGIIDNIQPWQRDMEQLSVDFDRIVTEDEIIIYAFCEGRATEQVGILVDFSSTQRSARGNCYMVEDADHMEVCKPPSKEHPSYELLRQFISTCQMRNWPVHQLWPPLEGNQRTELDVVFFHGLQLTANDTSDAWSSTWTQRGHDDVCWPREWLPFDLGEAVRIFSISYNAHVVTSPHDHVSEIAHNLFQTLINPRYEWHHPIVLIGHSFGGLVLKSLVVKLKTVSTIRNPTSSWSKATVQCAKVFLRNVRGVAFYAVPHAGSSNIPKYVKKLLRCNNRHHPRIMDNIRPWQRDMEQLSVDFDRIVTENEIIIYAFCEGRPMEQVGILVDFSSAQRSAGDNSYMVEDADHMEVCRPPSKEHPSYGLLLQFIITCGEVARECDQALQEVHDLHHSMYGVESYVERVETLVTSEGSDADPRYVGVWGMGGVGKTLLLQRVYGSPKVHGHFKEAKFIWLTVGQTPDIMALYWSLSEELAREPELNLNQEDYKHKLCNQFRQRRVFLVLDDVWQDKTFDSLDLAKGKGSVTLLSTRNQFLLERASPQISQEHMTPLSKEDSWSLFCVHAFRPPSNVPCELKALAQSMAEECQGLPLALKVIGRAMFGKTSPELQWEPLLKKLRESRLQERTVEEELYERLKLGYDLLSEDDWRLKDCFLYFAAFPEDCMSSFDEILWGWIGEGLVPGDGGDDPRADAFSLLSKLSGRSFIESNIEVSDDKRFQWFKLHDVMRDLAFYILKNDTGTPPAKQLYLYRAGQNLEEFPEEWEAILKARRLSLQLNKLESLPRRICAPKLVSLLLGGNPIQFVPGSFLRSFPKLRVLDLSGGEFRYLPEELGDLKDLVWLDLSSCENLEVLPDAVRKLHVLKSLLLTECPKLKYLPSGVVGLTSLQVLQTVGCEDLTWAEHTPPGMARAESLGHAHPAIPASLEDICGLVVLTELSICGKEDPGLELPHSISALTKLKVLHLQLDDVKTLPAEMPYWFKQLQELDLWGFESLEYLPSSFTCCGAFPALIKFQLGGCSTLVEFPEVHEGALPKLQTLDFSGCESLGTLPLSLELLPSLRKLILLGCDLTLQDSCRTNCEKSSIWRRFDIQYGGGLTSNMMNFRGSHSLDFRKSRG